MGGELWVHGWPFRWMNGLEASSCLGVGDLRFGLSLNSVNPCLSVYRFSAVYKWLRIKFESAQTSF